MILSFVAYGLVKGKFAAVAGLKVERSCWTQYHRAVASAAVDVGGAVVVAGGDGALHKQPDHTTP